MYIYKINIHLTNVYFVTNELYGILLEIIPYTQIFRKKKVRKLDISGPIVDYIYYICVINLHYMTTKMNMGFLFFDIFIT